MTPQKIEWLQSAEKTLAQNKSVAYLSGISDFKAALKARLEEEKPKRPWSDYDDGKVRAYEEILELIDEVTPLKP